MPARAALTSATMDRELHRIGQWWIDHAIDHAAGGFYGELDKAGRPVEGAAKGVILNTRILWFFSEVYRTTQKPEYGDAAERAFGYILDHFVDDENGGLYWEVDPTGKVSEARKQTYAQAFGIYSFSAHYCISKDDRALSLCNSLFDLMESKARDSLDGGYLEGFTRDWHPLEDMRLSEVDSNSPKSMNNQLHVLEAFTAFLPFSSDRRVESAIVDLLRVFRRQIISAEGQMRLFFTRNWQPLSGTTSCGHDIEASWLLLEAAGALGDPSVNEWLEPMVESMARACLNTAMCDGNYVINEIHADRSRDLTSPWWVQAEALVGFLKMFELTGDSAFIEAGRKIWTFIQEQHLDFEHGEWLWDARQDPGSGHRDYKAGAWKGPYHNGRSMMECSRILRSIEAHSDISVRAPVSDSVQMHDG